MGKYSLTWKLSTVDNFPYELESLPEIEEGFHTFLRKDVSSKDFLTIEFDDAFDLEEAKTKLNATVIAFCKIYSLDEEIELAPELRRVERFYEDGRRDATAIISQSIGGVACIVRPDAVVVNADGSIIDTKKNRIALRNRNVNILEKHLEDTTVQLMFERFKLAEKSPSPLIYYFEVLELAKSRIGRDVVKELGISKDEWADLRDWANDHTLLEGRHVGKKDSPHKSASQDQIWKAREIAKKVIKAFLNYLG